MQLFCCYKNVFTTQAERQITLEAICQCIRSEQLKCITHEIRRLTVAGQPKEAERLKMQLPAMAVSFLFPELRRGEMAGAYTGHIMVDVDHLEIPPHEYLAQWLTVPSVALAYTSVRGKGVHLLFRVEGDGRDHESACRQLFRLVEQKGGVAVDPSCKDKARCSLLCHDPECYFNPDAVPFRITPEPQTAAQPTLCTSTRRLALYLDEAERYGRPSKGERHSSLVSLAFCLNRAGFAERDVLDECLRRYVEPDFGEKEISKIISSTFLSGRAEHGINERTESAPANRSEASENASRRLTRLTKTGSDSKNDECSVKEPKEVMNEIINDQLKSYPDAVYDHLPPLLRDTLRPGMTPDEKALTLLTALSLLSTVTPRVNGSYHRKTTSPFLYTCVLAPAGSGKGVLNKVRDMLDCWHNFVRSNSRAEVKEYEQKLEAYELAHAQRKRKKTDAPLPEKPEPVLQKELSLSGDISRAKLIEQLAANGHYTSLMMETEIGILVAAIDQDYGKYTHLLNEVYHQEQISNSSKSGGTHRVKQPGMGLLVSGTFSQFTQFIPTAEDGLFSRFTGYVILEPGEWKDLDSADDTPAAANYYQTLGLRVMNMGIHLDKYATWVSYTPSQREHINKHYYKLLRHVQLFGVDEMLSLVFRTALQHFRICMTLTAIRKAEAGLTTERMVVSDEDFETALCLTDTSLSHMMVASTMLKKESSYVAPSDPTPLERIFESLPQRFTSALVHLTAEPFNIPTGTLKRHLIQWCKKGLIQRESRGNYVKRNTPSK